MGLIDVHHHALPPFYVEALAAAGVTRAGGVPIPRWTLSASRALLDKLGVSQAVLSVSSPGVEPFAPNEQVALASRLNEALADGCRSSGGRFRFFATMPTCPLDGRMRAVAHALDTLGAVGVVALTASLAHRLGDPGDEALFAELDRRGSVLFVHPHVADEAGQPAGLATSSLEFVFETTRTAMNLVLRGVLER